MPITAGKITVNGVEVVQPTADAVNTSPVADGVASSNNHTIVVVGGRERLVSNRSAYFLDAIDLGNTVSK